MTCRRLADDLAGGGVQCRKQAERAIALVFKSVALGTSGRQRKHPVLTVERLNRGLLVDAEHRCVGWRVQIQANHIGRLGLEVRIVGDHVSIHAMGLQVMTTPDTLHVHERNTQFGGQLAAAPVRGTVLRLALERVVEHTGFQSRQVATRCATRMPTVQACQPLLGKARSPRRDKARVTAQRIHDRVPRHTVVEQKNQLRASNLRHRRCALALQAFQLFSLKITQIHLSHAPYMGCNFSDSMD